MKEGFPRGWYPDPDASGRWRQWDGTRWAPEPDATPGPGAREGGDPSKSDRRREPAARPAGWYPDPQSSQLLRWWDGKAWVGHTRPKGVPPRSGLTGRLSADYGGAAIPASLGRRLLAWVVDCLLVFGVFSISYLDPGSYDPYAEPGEWVLVPMLGAVALLFWNWGWRQGRTGQSLGKSLMGLKLVRADGSQRPVGVAFGVFRALLTLLSSIGLWGVISLLFAADSKKGQRLADRIFDTQVLLAGK